MWLVPWAIWNLPIWIYNKITGTIKVTGFLSLMWSKLFLMVLTFVTIWYICRIVEEITADRSNNKLICLLILASPEMLISTCYAGQDEIMYIALFCMSLFYFLKEKWKLFYLCSVLAISFNPMMLIPFLVLLLMKEKEIYNCNICFRNTSTIDTL